MICRCAPILSVPDQRTLTRDKCSLHNLPKMNHWIKDSQDLGSLTQKIKWFNYSVFWDLSSNTFLGGHSETEEYTVRAGVENINNSYLACFQYSNFFLPLPLQKDFQSSNVNFEHLSKTLIIQQLPSLAHWSYGSSSFAEQLPLRGGGSGQQLWSDDFVLSQEMWRALRCDR